MRTAVPGLCGTVIVLRTFIAGVRSFAGFSAVLLVMFMRTVGTSTTVADVGTGLAPMVTQNIPVDNPCNGVTIAVKTGDNAGDGAAMTADLVRFIPGQAGASRRLALRRSICAAIADRYRWHA
jgi:Na+/H+-translocating membrane pyrophosphatase